MSSVSKRPERIVIFDAVMREGSLSGAARALGLSQPTVRRAIELLEEDLETKLFTRSDNGLLPNAQAKQLSPMAVFLVELSHAFRRTASVGIDDIAGRVRVTASHVMSHYILPGPFAEAREMHPNLTVELVPDDRTGDLLRRDADLAVRHVPPQQLQLVAQKVRAREIGLFGSAGFADSAYQTIEECIRTLPFVWEDRSRALADAAAGLHLPLPQQISARTDDQSLQVALIAAGVGVGICQTSVAKQLNLTRLASEWSADLPVWVVAHEDQVNTAPVRYLFDHLVSALT